MDNSGEPFVDLSATNELVFQLFPNDFKLNRLVNYQSDSALALNNEFKLNLLNPLLQWLLRFQEYNLTDNVTDGLVPLEKAYNYVSCVCGLFNNTNFHNMFYPEFYMGYGVYSSTSDTKLKHVGKYYVSELATNTVKCSHAEPCAIDNLLGYLNTRHHSISECKSQVLGLCVTVLPCRSCTRFLGLLADRHSLTLVIVFVIANDSIETLEVLQSLSQIGAYVFRVQAGQVLTVTHAYVNKFKEARKLDRVVPRRVVSRNSGTDFKRQHENSNLIANDDAWRLCSCAILFVN